ncbi:MAG: DNA methylase [Clostridia bacterium]|nr:DNA methylase [Clostridia bacterium]
MFCKQYIAIDLKSFYASVECVERGLDPLKTNLAVADLERTEKTICLAVTPALKAYGIPGRARLFELIEKLREVNAARCAGLPGKRFTGESYDADALRADPSLKIGYIAAKPRMSLYMHYSTRIYDVYLKYIAPEDVHVYSVDEVFIDATPYLRAYRMTAHEFAIMLIRDVLKTTGITATVGIGTNMYLCKVAMDIVAKRADADEDGVRIAALDEASYRRLLWDHRPITDFWRVGPGYAKRLASVGLYTMGDIARCSLGGGNEFYSEDLLYKMFGVNAELLIDHAWGWEPCTISQVRAYTPSANSVSTGQVLSSAYDHAKGRIIAREMADTLSLELTEKKLVTNQLVLVIGYDTASLTGGRTYTGRVRCDHYGRLIPEPSHGSVNLPGYTASCDEIMKAVAALYDRIADERLLIRRFNVIANNVIASSAVPEQKKYEQIDLFAQPPDPAAQRAAELEKRKREAILALKNKFGKNAVIRGLDLREGATTVSRNAQIGGHKE